MKLRAPAAFVAALTSFVCIVIIIVLLVLIRSLWRRSIPAVMRIITTWGDRAFRVVCAIMRITPVFRLSGLGAVPPCIVMANHQSTMDILLVVSLLRRIGLMDARWVGKREAKGFPLIGYLARKGGVIFVNRDGDPRDRERVREGALLAKLDDASIFLFPEGTRFAGKGPIEGSGFRHVLPVKPGGFGQLRAVYHDDPVLSVTLRWDPPVGERRDAKTIFQAAEYFGKTVYVETRLAPAAEVNADPDWLLHEWQRKDARLDACAQ